MVMILCNSYYYQTIRTLSLFIFPFFSLGMLHCHCYDPPEIYAQYEQLCIFLLPLAYKQACKPQSYVHWSETTAQPLTTGLRCRATSVAKNLNSTYWLDTSLAKDTRCFGWALVLGQAKPRQAPAKSSTFNCISVPNITIQCMRRLLIF